MTDEQLFNNIATLLNKKPALKMTENISGFRIIYDAAATEAELAAAKKILLSKE